MADKFIRENKFCCEYISKHLTVASAIKRTYLNNQIFTVVLLLLMMKAFSTPYMTTISKMLKKQLENTEQIKKFVSGYNKVDRSRIFFYS